MTSGSNRVSDMFILLMSFQSEKLLLFLANDGSMHSVGEGENFQPTSAAIFFLIEVKGNCTHLPSGPNSFIFMELSARKCKIIGWHTLSGVDASSPSEILDPLLATAYRQLLHRRNDLSIRKYSLTIRR